MMMMSRVRRPAGVGAPSVPSALAARMFLLAYDPAKGRLTAKAKLGRTLRAAALIDLQLRGNLADDNGKARVESKAAVPTDEVLIGILADIEASRPKKWRAWIDRRQGAILRQVRDGLEQEQVIKVERGRLFGLIPIDRVAVRHPLVRRQLAQRATDVLRPSRPVSQVDLRDAALIVLAATADLRVVLTKEQQRQHKNRLAQLAVRVGPVAPALKKALQAAQHASSGAA
ncbi:GPP34 family phosphoprotein [Kribbella sandramycini]